MQKANSFDAVDQETAKMQYDRWVAEKSETLDEFMLRKRKIELNNLVKKVIEEELSETEKQIVRLHWYEEKSLTYIAGKLNINKATVSRKLDRITETVYEKLKYAIEYRFGKEYLPDSAVIIKSKDPFVFSIKPDSTSKRIKHLRLSQSMTLEDVSEMTGISVSRLQRIEKAENDATASDLARIAIAFRTTTDHLIFGEEERKCRL
jgi:DNA-directed RNA polymerase specialized sigma subunit